MVRLGPDQVTKSACATRGHIPVIQESEPEVGYVGVTYCDECGVELGQDPKYQERRYRRPDRP